MNKSITQDTQNDNQISKTIRRFFTRFHVSSALKAVNAYKRKGIPVVEIFQYLFLLVFFNRSMYMNLLSGRNTPSFAKDAVYRFMKMTQQKFNLFYTMLSLPTIFYANSQPTASNNLAHRDSILLLLSSPLQLKPLQFPPSHCVHKAYLYISDLPQLMSLLFYSYFDLLPIQPYLVLVFQ